MKKLLALLLSAIMAFTLTACGGNDTPDLNPDGNGGDVTNPDGNGGDEGTTDPDGNGGTTDPDEEDEDDDDQIPEVSLNLTLNTYEFYNGNHLKIFVNSDLLTDTNFNDFTYTVTCDKFPNLNVFEQFNTGFGVFLNGNYGPGIEYTFDITATFDGVSETLTVKLTSPGTPIDPSADIQLPNIDGFVTKVWPDDFVVDFAWPNVYSSLALLMNEEDITSSVVYEYQIIDTDVQGGEVVATVEKGVTNSYLTSLLSTSETIVILEEYMNENNKDEINFKVILTLKPSQNPTIEATMIPNTPQESNNIGYVIPTILTGALTFSEFLEGSVGQADLQEGQIAGWYAEDDEYTALTTSFENDIISLSGIQQEEGNFWQLQFFGKFIPVTETGRYTETLIITSDVSGTIKVNGKDYVLEADSTVNIDLVFELTAGQAASLSIQFGTNTNGDITIGEFTDITIEGMSKVDRPILKVKEETIYLAPSADLNILNLVKANLLQASYGDATFEVDSENVSISLVSGADSFDSINPNEYGTYIVKYSLLVSGEVLLEKTITVKVLDTTAINLLTINEMSPSTPVFFKGMNENVLFDFNSDAVCSAVAEALGISDIVTLRAHVQFEYILVDTSNNDVITTVYRELGGAGGWETSLPSPTLFTTAINEYKTTNGLDTVTFKGGVRISQKDGSILNINLSDYSYTATDITM